MSPKAQKLFYPLRTLRLWLDEILLPTSIIRDVSFAEDRLLIPGFFRSLQPFRGYTILRFGSRLAFRRTNSKKELFSKKLSCRLWFFSLRASVCRLNRLGFFTQTRSSSTTSSPSACRRRTTATTPPSTSWPHLRRYACDRERLAVAFTVMDDRAVVPKQASSQWLPCKYQKYQDRVNEVNDLQVYLHF